MSEDIKALFKGTNIGTVKIKDNEFPTDRQILDGDDIKILEVEGNKFKDMSKEDFTIMKTEILKEIETMLEEARAGKPNPKANYVVQILSSALQGVAVEGLKSWGVIPPAPPNG
ncbi:hypothetical protein ABES25_06145 [Bacillus gobiensis]|uniref:hypothetical protein n=1 Tax=Bacillus gobiensis TaxID=1441095 RepID=UPI003D2121AF